MASPHQTLAFLTAIVLISLFTLLASADSERKIDCRRIVFHPYCRGISAKRGLLAKLQESDDDQLSSDVREREKLTNGNWRQQLDDKPTGLYQHGRDNLARDIMINTMMPRLYPDHQNGLLQRYDPYHQGHANNGQWLNPYREQDSGYRRNSRPNWHLSPSSPLPEAFVPINDHMHSGSYRNNYSLSGRQNRILYHPNQRTPNRSPRYFPSAPYDLDFLYKRNY